MIQPMGKKPVTAPRTTALMARPAGIVKAKTATAIATSSAITAAIGALTLFDAIKARRVMTGNAATRVESIASLNGS
jgi:hypothetical protein